MPKTPRRKPRRLPETQIRLRQLTDAVRALETRIEGLALFEVEAAAHLNGKIDHLTGLVFAAHAVPVPPKADE
jgi:hypothetical protein